MSEPTIAIPSPAAAAAHEAPAAAHQAAAAAADPFQQLHQVLQEFRTFLDANVATILTAVQALRAVLPQINDLIDKLIALMNSLKTEIQRLDPSAIPGLDKVTALTGEVSTLLGSVETLLPAEAAAIAEVRAALGVVGSLQQLNQIKADLLSLVDAIIADLNRLKA